MENKGFRLLSYESLEPGEGDELIFYTYHGYINCPVGYGSSPYIDSVYGIEKTNNTANGNTFIINERTDQCFFQPQISKNDIWAKVMQEVYSMQKSTHPNNKKTEIYTFNQTESQSIYGEKISINCIVGKNGCGKSSIIEMISRIMNNLAFASFGAKGEYHLFYIENVFAKLKYILDNEEYTISMRGRKIMIEKGDCVLINQTINPQITSTIPFFNESFEGKETIKNTLDFFAVVFNYSMYSYSDYKYIQIEKQENSNFFVKNGENKGISYITDWFANYNLFCNNDDYNTPLSLNPERIDNKYVDISQLNNLSNTNMLKLCFYYDKEMDYPLREFANNKIFHQISISKTELFIDRIGRDEYEENLLNDIFAKYELTDTINNCAIINECKNYITYKRDEIKNKISITDEKQLNENILLDHSEATEKIRRVLAFLKLFDNNLLDKTNKYYQILTEQSPDPNGKIVPLDEYIRIEKDEDEEGYREITYLNHVKLYIDKQNKIYNQNKETFFNDKEMKIELFDLLPLPMLEYELQFKDTISNKIREFNGLSSGERQMAYIRSNFLYHLYNINANHYSTLNKKYDNVLVMFDEVELYLHPEWQRKFISNLLEGIELAKFDNIKHINMLISTHSPFILSDVPKSNILFLNEDGTPNYEERGQTFGANIHDLLKNGFFMESTIGEFARKQIQEIVDKYYEFKDAKEKQKAKIRNNEKQRKKFWYIQSIIGDQYYKNTLKFMLEEIYGSKPEDEIERLEREKAEIEKRLNQLKGGQ